MKKEIIIFFGTLFLAMFIIGCSQNPLQNEKIMQPEQQIGQQQQAIQIPPECAGKKAADINLPESCKNWFSMQNPQGQSTQVSGNKCPDSICDDFEMKGGICPEDCKNVEGWQEKAQQQPGQPVMPEQQGPPERTLSVKALQSSYKTIAAKPSGWFKTGQDADIMPSLKPA